MINGLRSRDLTASDIGVGGELFANTVLVFTGASDKAAPDHGIHHVCVVSSAPFDYDGPVRIECAALTDLRGWPNNELGAKGMLVLCSVPAEGICKLGINQRVYKFRHGGNGQAGKKRGRGGFKKNNWVGLVVSESMGVEITLVDVMLSE